MARGREIVEERLQRTTVGRIELGSLRAQVLAEHVDVASEPKLVAQPGQLVAKGLGPGRLQKRRRGSQHRPQAPRCDAELVELLGVFAEAHSRIVGQHPRELLAEEHAQALEIRRRRR